MSELDDLRKELEGERFRTALWAMGSLDLPDPWKWGFANARVEQELPDGRWLLVHAPQVGRRNEMWEWALVLPAAGPRGSAVYLAFGKDLDPLTCVRAVEAAALDPLEALAKL